MKAAAIAAFLAAIVAAQTARVWMPFRAARPILEELGRPSTLPVLDPARWTEWLRRQDQDIRARLDLGDEDSMVHLLLFGTSFTQQPRIEFAALGDATRTGVLRARVDDLLRGLRSPGANERLAFLQGVLRRRGIDPRRNDGKAGVFLYESLQRVLRENSNLARRVGDAAAFRDRGVSLDATVFPNFGVEQALRDLKNRGLLPATVERAAVIGPGLDFTDKDSGYDFYPQQTLQPFALYDSLAGLGLAGGNPRIAVFDVSNRVLQHLDRARAAQGRGYRIQLTHDPKRVWTAEVHAYWRRFGDSAAKPVPPVSPPALLAGLETRAVELRPDVVAACSPIRLNVILERLNLPLRERFDVMVATNIFVYYDRLQQALALANVSALLKTGGILISNDELPIAGGVPMRRIGALKVSYTTELGDSMIYYQRQ